MALPSFKPHHLVVDTFGSCDPASEFSAAFFPGPPEAVVQNSDAQLFAPQKSGTIQNRYRMPREVALRLKEMLAAKGMAHAELAKRVGVSKATVAAYCANRWTVLDRTVLERLADVLQCEAGSLLVTEESRFFDPYANHAGSRPTCIYLRRPDAETLEIGRPMGHRDNLATGRVDRLLEDAVEGMVAIEDSATTLAEFGERVRQNCVVLGSPMVNAASEIALCRAFGVEPFQAAQSGDLPFHFRVVATPETLEPSAIIKPSPDDRRGIWLRDEKELLQADAWPREEFRRMELKRARDCAVVLVLNHQTADDPRVRKLVVLSGFRGVGTEGAAMALADHYRDLEPPEKNSPVWGALEVFYKKSANSMTREILGYKWRYRPGGRCPVAFTFQKP